MRVAMVIVLMVVGACAGCVGIGEGAAEQASEVPDGGVDDMTVPKGYRSVNVEDRRHEHDHDPPEEAGLPPLGTKMADDDDAVDEPDAGAAADFGLGVIICWPSGTPCRSLPADPGPTDWNGKVGLVPPICGPYAPPPCPAWPEPCPPGWIRGNDGSCHWPDWQPRGYPLGDDEPVHNVVRANPAPHRLMPAIDRDCCEVCGNRDEHPSHAVARHLRGEVARALAPEPVEQPVTDRDARWHALVRNDVAEVIERERAEAERRRNLISCQPNHVED